MLKNTIKVISILLSITLLFLLSEGIFVWYHPTQLTTYGYSLAKFQSKRQETNKSLSTIVTTAFYFHELNTKTTIDKFNNEVVNRDLGVKFGNDYNNYITKLPYTSLMSTGSYDYPRVLYEIGLLAYSHDLKPLTYLFWEIAAKIDPTLSYWTVELANLNFTDGKKDLAINILEKCQKLESPGKHCKEFLESVILPGINLKPGFLLSETQKYYGYESILLTDFDSGKFFSNE